MDKAEDDCAPGERDIVRAGFDASYYRREYPDLALNDEGLLDHFVAAGWREGRNPCAGFDTLRYLLGNADVAACLVDPYAHYLATGKAEGRSCEPAASPSRTTMRLFGRPVVDWVERLRPYLDPIFYAGQLGVVFHHLAGIDLAAHFAFRGWREGLSPHRGFDTRAWLARHPDLADALVNPLLIALERAPAAHRVTDPAPDEQPGPPAPLPAEQIALIRTGFWPAYYLRTYKDAARSGLDALTHYVTRGWRLGYRPNPGFDPTHYAAAYPDVGSLNPFWHYLAYGRAEGRTPLPPGGLKRRIVEAATPPATPEPGAMRLAAAGNRLDPPRLAERLAAPRRGLVLSLSHDRYSIYTGGTQIFIADEQRKFNRRGWTYLHLSPACPALTLVEAGDAFAAWVTVDGEAIGCLAIDDLLAVLAQEGLTQEGGAGPRIMVVHSLLGFDAEAVCRLAAAFQPGQSFVWLHDYSTVCAGFNLLRNDATFCHAPPPDSLACRVCVYGTGRARHLVSVAEIFARIDFTVMAPSDAAAATWRAASRLPFRELRVHPHWRLRQGGVGPRRRTSRVLTVAFVGSQFASKGWPAFAGMVERLGDDPLLRFMLFATEDAHRLPGVTFVPTQVSALQRTAMVDALREAAVDVVVMLSPWPETFSFVAHEALAAGCLIACLEASGNVATLVRETGRGAVFAREEEIENFLACGAASLMARQRQDEAGYAIEDSGTTEPLLVAPLLPD
jgi:hypothetical protein